VILDDFGADMGGLKLHLLHEPGALDDIGKTGVILDIGGYGHLAAGLKALDENGSQHGAGGIDGCRPAGRAGSQDYQPAVFGHGPESSLKAV
jgi:hypothetical protein